MYLRFAVGLSLLSVALASPSHGAIKSSTIALLGATIIDGTGGKPISDGAILIKDGRIAAVGEARSIRLPAHVRTLNLSGKYIIPGLMDANVHLLLDIEVEPLITYEGHYDDLIIEAAQVALKNGVTTVFDTWGPRDALVRARTRINNGNVPGARIFLAGNIIGFDGPFSSDFSQTDILDAGFVKRVNDAWKQGVGADLLWRTPEQVRTAVRHYIDTGQIDFLKYASSGHTNERFIAFSPDAQRAIVEEGHKAGLIVQAHSTSVESLRLEIEAGVDLMQHCSYTGIEPMPASTLKMIVERRIPCAAMLKTAKYAAWAATHNRRENFSREEEVEQENNRALIKAQATLLLTTDAGVFRQEAESNPSLSSFLKDVPDQPILLSDAEFLWLEAAHELGMSPMDALMTGTRNPAAAYGILKDVGTIEPGKRADMVVLDADPLEDPKNYRTIHAVLKDGAIVDRDRLPSKHFLTPSDARSQ